MAEIKEITKENFDTDVLENKDMQLVYYYAPWCKPCQEMEEIVDQTADDLSEKMEVVKVNTDLEAEIVTQQKIRVVPSYQVFNAGAAVETIRGPFTKLELLAQLSNFIMEEESEAPAEEEGDKEDSAEKSEDNGDTPAEASSTDTEEA